MVKDTFTNTDGTALETHGTWDNMLGDWQIASNRAQNYNLFSGHAICRWTADNIVGAQFAETLSPSTTDPGPWDNWVGPAVRVNDSDATCYALHLINRTSGSIGTNNLRLYRIESGSATLLDDADATGLNTAGGDVVRLEIDVDGILTAKVNGVTLITFDDANTLDDSNRYTGIAADSTAAHPEHDDFDCGAPATAVDGTGGGWQQQLAAAAGTVAVQGLLAQHSSQSLVAAGGAIYEMDLTDPNSTIVVRVRSTAAILADQYHCGSWWVRQDGNVRVVSITPTPETTTDKKNGAQLNPDGQTAQGYDGRVTNIGYSDAANWGRALVLAGTPQDIPVSAGTYSSLCCTIGLASPGDGGNAFVDRFGVFTFVGTGFVPTDGNTLRPWWVGPIKQPSHKQFSDINTGLLPSISHGFDSGDVGDWIADVSKTRGPEHSNGWAWNIHATGQMGGYYQIHNREMSVGCVLLGSDQKTDALVRGIVQYGMDIYGFVANGMVFRGNLGHSTGRLQPALIAAKLLGETTWINNIKSLFWAEHEQFFFVHKMKSVSEASVSTSPRFYYGEECTISTGGTCRWFGHDGLGNLIWFGYETGGSVTNGVTITSIASGATCVVNGTPSAETINFGDGGYTVGAGYFGFADWMHDRWGGGQWANGDERPKFGADLAWPCPPASAANNYRRGPASQHMGMAVRLRQLGMMGDFGGPEPLAYFLYQPRFRSIEPTGGPYPPEDPTATWTPGEYSISAPEEAAYLAEWGSDSIDGTLSSQLRNSLTAVGTVGLGGTLVARQSTSLGGFSATIPITGAGGGLHSQTMSASSIPSLSGGGSGLQQNRLVAAGFVAGGTSGGNKPKPPVKRLLMKQRVHNALHAFVKAASFYPCEVSSKTGQMTIDTDKKVSPTGITIKEVKAGFRPAANYRREFGSSELSVWHWVVKANFSTEVACEEFEHLAADAGIPVPRTAGLTDERALLARLLDCDYSHPPEQSPNTGSAITFVFEVVPDTLRK